MIGFQSSSQACFDVWGDWNRGIGEPSGCLDVWNLGHLGHLGRDDWVRIGISPEIRVIWEIQVICYSGQLGRAEAILGYQSSKADWLGVEWLKWVLGSGFAVDL